jgi:hypothetical protein
MRLWNVRSRGRSSGKSILKAGRRHPALRCAAEALETRRLLTAFSYTGSVQTYSVLTTGTYALSAAGAGGGASISTAGGSGVVVGGDVALTAGETLDIVVGGEGDTGNIDPDGNGAGGGGGTFVFDGSNNLLIVAGGGGGSGYDSPGGDAQTGTSGADGGGSDGNAGTSGGGGGVGAHPGDAAGGGGAGWLGNGVGGSDNFYDGLGGSGPTTFAGGAGEYAAGPYPDGGFGGGGGGGESGGGGGGGYSGGGGGGAADVIGDDGGGGGGSYFAPSFSNTASTGTETGNGFFNITLLPTPTITSAAQPTTAVIGSSIADKATVTGGNNPGGNVTFNLYNNATATGTPLYTDTEILSGGRATSGSFTPTAVGTDYWVATYNGDANNASISTGDAEEPVNIASLIYTGAIQTYTVPTTGIYALTVAGAQGGANGSNPGGLGAVLSGDVSLNAGTTLQVVVGGTNSRFGGGGGSFVFVSGAAQPLIAAGGGGGGGLGDSGLPANTGTSGSNDVSTQDGAGGTGGNGGAGGTANVGDAGGGAGWLGNGGGDPERGYGGTGGLSAPTFAGGQGDSRDRVAPNGGFGGGGGGGEYGDGVMAGGGGGGYSGGGGGAGDSGDAGGGGGSYFAASFTNTATAVTETGDGLFSISLLSALPTITTAAQPAAATPGASISDKATLTGGVSPTGTVTFNLYDNNAASGMPLFTDTESLSNGSATSANFPTTASGTDYWVATYNGDGNNSIVSSGDAADPVAIGSLTVNTTSDTANPGPGLNSLLNAINYANAHPGADTIVLPSKGVFDLTVVDNNWYGPNALPPIDSNITIQGNGATLQRDSSLAQDTADAFRFFYVSGGIQSELPLGTLTLTNLTLTNGLAKGGDSGFGGGGGMGAGGAIFNQGNLTLNGVTLTANTALAGSGDVGSSTAGGGIGQDANGDTGGGFGGSFPAGIYGGTAGSNGGGGGFSADGNGNNGGGLSALGGAGGFSGVPDGGDGGSASGSGGIGGDFGFGGSLDSQFIGGAGGVGGGGSHVGGGGFGGGGGSGGVGGFGGGGGALDTSGGFGGGSGSDSGGGGGAGLGGAIFSMYGSATILNSTLTGDSAHGGDGYTGGEGDGGAIFNLDGTLNVTLSTLANNTVTAGGGQTDGGGSNGSADGGGIYNLAYGNNYATGGAVSAAATIDDSILSGTVGGPHDLVSAEIDGANANSASVSGTTPNIIGSLEHSSGLNGTSSVSLPGLIQSDPKLASLGNYGGPTKTMAPLPGSPAIDDGSNASIPNGVTTDQRGDSRIVNGTVDIGAYESEGFTIATTGGTPQSTLAGSAFATKLGVKVTSKNANLTNLAGGQVTFTAPVNGASATFTTSPITLAADGTGSTTATANSTPGGPYNVSATALGITTPANFVLTNTSPNKASPSISTSAQPTTAAVGTSIADKATVTGGDSPTGTVTFRLYNNANASGTPLFTDTESLSHGTATSRAFITIATGTFYWVDTYNGDRNNNCVISGKAAEPVTITKAVPGFSQLTNSTILIHTPSTTVTGKISAGSLIPPGSVTVTLHGVTQSATIKSNGTFTTTFATGNLPVGMYSVKYAYAGSPDFAPINPTSTLNVTFGIKPEINNGGYKAGATIPIQILLTDFFGHDVDTTNTKVTATGIALASSCTRILPLPPVNPAGGRFTANSAGDLFTLNLNTTGLAVGQYVLYFTITGDPVTHSLTFSIHK